MGFVPLRRLDRLNRLATAALALALAGGCATPAPRTIDATQLRPQANEVLKIDRALLLVDTSGSISRRTLFPDAKALVEAFVQGMPDGQYETGVIAFGGKKRETLALAPFARTDVAGRVSSLTHLGEDSRPNDVINEASAQLAGSSGDTAIVLFSDGVPSFAGREQPAIHTLDAARNLIRSQSGRVCFHTVQIGDEAAGADLLRQLAELTTCGSTRTASSIENGSNLLIAQRSIFLEESLPSVAAAPLDGDRDGVGNDRDRCPRTPIGAEVDLQGCWVLMGINYDHDSISIGRADSADLAALAVVLRANPDLRIRIVGHADDSGAGSYNQSLSERRARGVQRYLESEGIDGARIETQGHGDTQPVADNGTADGRALNRRAELWRSE